MSWFKNTKEKRRYFSTFFKLHYKRLCNYAYKVLGDATLSEDLVQETFIKFWENIEKINRTEQVAQSYLIITLKNKIVDSHRKSQVFKKHIDLYKLNRDTQLEIDNQWEFAKQIDRIYTTLPQKTEEIFRLSRDKGLSYKEIARQKNISIKSVEHHMSNALAAFRKGLTDLNKKK